MFASRYTYECFIQKARRNTAIVLALSVIGFALSVCSGFWPGVLLFPLAHVVGWAVVVLLYVEQILVVWIATTRGRISLASLMLIVTGCCVFFAITRHSVVLAVALALIALATVAASLEGKRREVLLHPKDADDYYNRGNARLDRLVVSAAIADYTEAIRRNPQYAKAYYNRGVAYERKRQWAKAEADFAKATLLGLE